MKARVLPRLIVVFDPERSGDPMDVARALPRGAALLYRHFGSPNRHAIVLRLVRVARRRGAVVWMSGDLRPPRGVRGLHWPESRRMQAWRRHPSAGLFYTQAAHGVRGVMRASRQGVDGALVSTVFASRSRSAGRPIGPVRLRLLAQHTRTPLYALGGVSCKTAKRLLGARLAGFAAVDGFRT